MNESLFKQMWNDGVPSEQIAAHFGIKKATTQYWRSKFGLPVRTGNGERPMPDDLREMAEKMTVEELRAHYQCGKSTITKWRKALGITVKLYTGKYNNSFREKKVEVPRKPKPLPAAERRLWSQNHAAPKVDGSIAAIARNYLRRTYANVHSASITVHDSVRDDRGHLVKKSDTWADVQNRKLGLGIPDHGKGWNFVSGVGVISDDALVELAERLGWDRDEWKQVA